MASLHKTFNFDVAASPDRLFEILSDLSLFAEFHPLMTRAVQSPQKQNQYTVYEFTSLAWGIVKVHFSYQAHVDANRQDRTIVYRAFPQLMEMKLCFAIKEHPEDIEGAQLVETVEIKGPRFLCPVLLTAIESAHKKLFAQIC